MIKNKIRKKLKALKTTFLMRKINKFNLYLLFNDPSVGTSRIQTTLNL